MAIENATENDSASTEEGTDEDFESGFNPAASTLTPTPAVETNDDAKVGDVVAVEKPAPEPEYVQITKGQLENLLNLSTAIPEIKAENKRQFDAAFGKIGGIKEAVDKIQAATPAGEAVEISAEDFAEMREEFPELAEMQVKGLNKVLSKLRGTGKPFDPSQFDGRVDERVQAATQEVANKFESRILRAYHKDWIEVVRSDDFKAWQKTLPADDQSKLASSGNSEEVADYIDKFKASKKPVAVVEDKAANSRQKRLEAAINPKGTGGHAAGPTEDDEFLAGFNSRKTG